MLPLLLALLLSPTGEAGKIIGGHEAKPHSHPYMAFLEYHVSEKSFICGGLLVREDFVLTAAHCWGSSINVTLRDHNIYQQERTQQVIPYDPFSCSRELRRKAYLTTAVSPIRLPWRRELVKPGMVCSVAGWGHLGVNNPVAEKLQEADHGLHQKRETPPQENTTLFSRTLLSHPYALLLIHTHSPAPPYPSANVAT
ncbi:mast cell protease 3-like [Eubalaena glacialis]|uniref:mast cell protease 3-like n=1 Tax=Eubalaena glacialis TaxID=27606 RepID=UPI002A5A5CF8|nr:mast cell protease 3-like [Eubalaena glacialis]